MSDDRRHLAERYRLDGVLARGGMGEVQYGYDERLDRSVAVKLLRPAAAPADDVPGAQEIRDELERDRARFLREIRTMARLELPGIPAVYDTGVERGGSVVELWLVMQLLRGTTVQAVLDATDADQLTVPWAAAVTAQTAAVLADVHRVDVVHRDIKPANLMIVDGGLVKVLDFGISILRGSGALPRLTQVDRTVGTPPYMSPEQCLGQPVAASSDVYSLGCLLCELLTGDAPFLDTPQFSLRAQHVLAPPPSVRDRRPDVPGALDDLVATMLAKDAVQRPSAEEVYEALGPWRGLECAADPERDPTRPFRRPLLRAARRSVTNDSSPAGPGLSDDEVEELWVDVSALLAAGRQHEALERVETDARRPTETPYGQLRLRHCLAVTLFAAGAFTRSAPVLVEVGREYRRRLGPLNPLSSDCDFDAGLAFAEVGDHEQAVPPLRRFVEHASDADVDRTVDARTALAAMLAAAGDHAGAVAELRSLRATVVGLHGENAPAVRNLDRQVAALIPLR